MLKCRWTFFLAATVVFGQEIPFSAESTNPWKPAWEFTLRGDKLVDPVETADSFQRVNLQLRLRWAWETEALKVVAGVRTATGSDGNPFNAPRWDQQTSNITEVDVAHVDVGWVAPKSFGSLRLGFQELRLLTSEAIWDRDLRFLGAGGMVGFRDSEGVVQEAGLRGATGRVRNILGGDVDLAAGQMVLKLDTGPCSWVAHAGRWNLAWDAGTERLRRLPGQSNLERQHMSLDVAGASGTWNTVFPLEARWFSSKNRDTREDSEEVQAVAGSRERPYWPQVSFTWQRLSSTGTLYPLNGDEWWFYRKAQGHRVDLALPLPGHWIVSFMYLRQRLDGDDYEVTRKMIVLVKRF
jgi:hypothetical protein